MTNKELIASFLEVNDKKINEMVSELLGLVSYDENEGVHLFNSNQEVFNTYMLNKKIGEVFPEFLGFSNRVQTGISNKVYSMLLPVEEQKARTVAYKKKVNKMKIKKLDQKRQARKEAEEALNKTNKKKK